MTLGSVSQAAFAADPLACYATVLALGLVAWNIVLRRGGANAGSIIRIFGSCATIATMFKLLWWLVAMIFTVDHPPAAPSGTDGVLVLGTMVAGLYVLVEDIRGTVVDADARGPSLAGAAMAWVAARGPLWLAALLGGIVRSEIAATETPGAARARESMGPAGPEDPDES